VANAIAARVADEARAGVKRADSAYDKAERTHREQQHAAGPGVETRNTPIDHEVDEELADAA
jgi:hypothetical protein